MRTIQWPESLRLTLAALALCIAPAWLAGQQPAPVQPAQQKLEQVKQNFEEQQAEFMKQFGDVEDEAVRNELYKDYQDMVKQALSDAREIADEAAGTETAAEAWGFVLMNAPRVGNRELSGKALDILIEKHLASPTWKELTPMIGDLPQGLDEEAAERAMRRLMEKSPFKGVQAAAMFGLGAFFMESEDEAKRAAGLALLVSVTKEFAEVKEAKEYVKRAAGALFRLEKLQPGMPCPDFEASDANGVKFKLSDYKGKVVLIDFWGFW